MNTHRGLVFCLIVGVFVVGCCFFYNEKKQTKSKARSEINSITQQCQYKQKYVNIMITDRENVKKGKKLRERRKDEAENRTQNLTVYLAGKRLNHPAIFLP